IQPLLPAQGRALPGTENGLVFVKNPHLDLMEEDVLYHLDLGTKTHNLPAMFGDIKVKSRSKSLPAGSALPWQLHSHPPPTLSEHIFL
uniref:Uncharacterized protein n=1 Tax=Zonotrichia albicollis TaxID=44394 RepID=A0A8D2M402_ZONAL